MTSVLQITGERPRMSKLLTLQYYIVIYKVHAPKPCNRPAIKITKNSCIIFSKFTSLCWFALTGYMWFGGQMLDTLGDFLSSSAELHTSLSHSHAQSVCSIGTEAAVTKTPADP